MPIIRKSVPAVQKNTAGLYFAGEKENIDFIQSGCTVLDCVLGGGWARGRMANIVGDKSTGKSLLIMEAIANCVKQYPKARIVYKELENAFDEAYARALGIPMDQVELEQLEQWTVEAFMQDVDAELKSKNPPAMYIIDSLDAMTDEAELEKDPSKQGYGTAKAKLLSQFFRTRNGQLAQAGTLLLIVSQIRDNMNAMPFAKKWVRAGGKALDFYASQIILLTNTGKLTKQVNKIERVYGVKVKANAEKNKVGLPYRDCEFKIIFGYGVDDKEASATFLKAAGIAPPKDGATRDFIVNAWNDIEQSFLPPESKYGD